MAQSLTVLPLEAATTRTRQRFDFSTPIRGRVYNFTFYYNGAGDFWVMTIIKGDDNNQLHRSKVLLDTVLTFPSEGWALYFHDFGNTETGVTGQNLGDPVRGVIIPYG